jgi:hypothetical protein
LDRTSPRSFFITLFALLLLLGTCACSVPLAPGYQIVNETREIRFGPGDTPEIGIRARYTLKNSGTADLEFIDITFPDAKAYGLTDLKVELDGHGAKLVDLPQEFQTESPNTSRLRFDSVWKRGEKHELASEYTFRSPADPGDRVSIGQQDFHLGSRGWSLLPLPPKHFLSPFPARRNPTSYSVIVPSDFLVLAGGTLKGRQQSGATTNFKFELRKSDMPPAIVAGRYVASHPEPKANSAIFWTLQPLKDDPRAAVEKITAVWNALTNDFGPLGKNIRVPHIVESTSIGSQELPQSIPAAVAFPGGVLVSPALLSLGLNSEAFQERVTHELAHNWFGGEVFFSRFTAIGLGEGLPEYATIVADESQKGEAGRRARVLNYLREYDEARKNAEEIPLGIATRTDPLTQQRIAEAKAALFFVAVEDTCGEKQMRDGLKELIELLRGQEVNYDVLRAQLEHVSGKNLADLFRVWLNDKGIPEDFRARYES